MVSTPATFSVPTSSASEIPRRYSSEAVGSFWPWLRLARSPKPGASCFQVHGDPLGAQAWGSRDISGDRMYITEPSRIISISKPTCMPGMSVEPVGRVDLQRIVGERPFAGRLDGLALRRDRHLERRSIGAGLLDLPRDGADRARRDRRRPVAVAPPCPPRLGPFGAVPGDGARRGARRQDDGEQRDDGQDANDPEALHTRGYRPRAPET